MSFWSDASPIVKVVIVGGGVGILLFVLMLTGTWPFDPYDGESVSDTQRGLQTGQ